MIATRTNTPPTTRAFRGCLTRIDRFLLRRDDVEEREEADPDDVDEVPIDRRRLDRVMVTRRELPAHRPEEHDAQHDDAAEDVGPVEARQREERRPERAVRQPEAELAVVVDLADEERDAHD